MSDLTELMKAFTNETRLRILVLLFQKQLCVCELQGILDKPQPQISKQLGILKELNLLSDIKKDKFVFYSLKDNELIQSLISTILESIDQYPQLSIDIKKCKDSHIYREGKC